MKEQLFIYLLHLADNALILGQRNSEWTGHGPVLEQDIAITNISLDLIGQARNFYDHAASVFNAMNANEKAAVDQYIPRNWKTFDRELTEDDLAFLRDENQYLNLLITELPIGDWAFTILRQFLFTAYQHNLYKHLENSNDAQLSAIAEKSVKETAYHLRWSSEWVIRLGDGTEESNKRIKAALEELWMFTGESFISANFETDLAKEGIAVDVAILHDDWNTEIEKIFSQATLEVPKTTWSQKGGKKGHHTEYLGYLLAEMQYLQRTYPNATW